MSFTLLVICFLLLSTTTNAQNDILDLNTFDDISFREITDPDHFRNVSQLIASRGFHCEEHFVTTEDGYILSVHRIVHPLLSSNDNNIHDASRTETRGSLKKRGVVLLQHGLMSTAHDFVINNLSGFIDELIEEDDSYLEKNDSSLVKNNLGFELAKRGYDVWLANSRGNIYSRNHTTLDPDHDSKFWDFTYDEMIKYDLPATIDYIRATSQSKTLAYIGHSQGSLIVFGLLSTRPEYSEILKPVIALAPVATLGSIGTPIRHLTKIPFLTTLLKRMSPEFLTQGWVTKFIADRLCSSRFAVICSNIMFIANGFSTEQLDLKRVGVYANHYPAGTSSKNIDHYSQGVKHGRFCMYDYGKKKNHDLYGHSYPAEYPLEKVNGQNLILMHSDNDLLATPRDVKTLVSKLGGVDKIYDKYEVPLEHWNHLDFLIGKQSGQYINWNILKYLKEFDV